MFLVTPTPASERDRRGIRKSSSGINCEMEYTPEKVVFQLNLTSLW